MSKTAKQKFIQQLAEFLCDNQAAKGILLQVEGARMTDPRPNLAVEWAALRSKTPLFGYPTVEEAVEQLTEFLT